MDGMNPYHYLLSCISGKWKLVILHSIHEHGSIRFSQTYKQLPISEKVLSQQLKELIEAGLVRRVQYETIPLRVEYFLTPAGEKLTPAVDLLYTWSIDRMTQLDIPIDPDAFEHHSDRKYLLAVTEIMEHYEELCDLHQKAEDKGIPFEAFLETLRDMIDNTPD